MDRWTGVVKVSLNTNYSGPFFKVAASLLFSPSSKTLIPPSLNAIFFNGDRVQGTGNPVIERLSDPENIARILVSKFGSSATNAWVLEASSFNGPFAVYKELIPSVNSFGDPKRYDPDGFPASSNIVDIMSKSIDQIKSQILSSPAELEAQDQKSDLEQPTNAQSPAPRLQTALPKTIILGFSKGGIVINQIISELAHLKPSPQSFQEPQDHIFPVTKDELLASISEVHYIDVGLNSAGAYLTDSMIVRTAVENLLVNHKRVRFMIYGTPRQWCDERRSWIHEEKDVLLQQLREAARRYEGRLQVAEKLYFAKMPPSLQMHFEIIETIDID